MSLNKETNTVKAKLKWFNATKGFGFVIPEGTDIDAFLHITQLQKMGVYGLGEGAEVLCRVEYGEKGANVIEVLEILSLGNCTDKQVSFDPEEKGEYSAKGIVKLYYEDKGFGFISPDDGMKDIFIHKSCLDRCEIESIEAGQRVRIKYKVAEKGREATEISVEGPF
ncbi:MAG: cold shock domain-containing protein [Alphaproteobacteria bacterium]|nr:cold shock domain-containing protein [Alphaproteobacteria bacterium]